MIFWCSDICNDESVDYGNDGFSGDYNHGGDYDIKYCEMMKTSMIVTIRGC